MIQALLRRCCAGLPTAARNVTRSDTAANGSFGGALQQIRHRWIGADQLGGEPQAMDYLNNGIEAEGLLKRYNSRAFYVKPYVARNERYSNWVRRRSYNKITNLLNFVRYRKASLKRGNPNLQKYFDPNAAKEEGKR